VTWSCSRPLLVVVISPLCGPTLVGIRPNNRTHPRPPQASPRSKLRSRSKGMARLQPTGAAACLPPLGVRTAVPGARQARTSSRTPARGTPRLCRSPLTFVVVWSSRLCEAMRSKRTVHASFLEYYLGMHGKNSVSSSYPTQAHLAAEHRDLRVRVPTGDLQAAAI
jgi:hypothetical protein